MLLGVDPTSYLRTADDIERRVWEYALADAWKQKNDRDKAMRDSHATRVGNELASVIARMLKSLFR